MQINIELSPLHYIFENLYTKGCGMLLATLVKHRIARYHILRTLLICTKLVVSLLESKPISLASRFVASMLNNCITPSSQT